MQTRRNGNPLLSARKMDREHLTLIAAENEFSAAVDREAPRAELEMRLTLLIDGFRAHFDSEEGLMASNGFPGLKSHTKEHRELIEQLTELRDDLGAGAINLCSALSAFVRLWTEEHIRMMDSHLSNFLSSTACNNT